MGANVSKRGSYSLYKFETKDKKRSALLKASSIVNLTQAEIYGDSPFAAASRPCDNHHDEAVYDSVSEEKATHLEDQIEVVINNTKIFNKHNEEEAEQQIKIPSNVYSNDEQVLVTNKADSSSNPRIFDRKEDVIKNITFNFGEQVEKENTIHSVNLQSLSNSTDILIAQTATEQNEAEKYEEATTLKAENHLLSDQKLKLNDNLFLGNNFDEVTDPLSNKDRKKWTHSKYEADLPLHDNVSTEANLRPLSSPSWDELFENLLAVNSVSSYDTNSTSKDSNSTYTAEGQIEVTGLAAAPYQKGTNSIEQKNSHKSLLKSTSVNSDVYYEFSEDSEAEQELFFDAIHYEESSKSKNSKVAVLLDGVKTNDTVIEAVSEAQIEIIDKLVYINKECGENENQMEWELSNMKHETSEMFNDSLDEVQIEVINTKDNAENDNDNNDIKFNGTSNVDQVRDMWISPNSEKVSLKNISADEAQIEAISDPVNALNSLDTSEILNDSLNETQIEITSTIDDVEDDNNNKEGLNFNKDKSSEGQIGNLWILDYAKKDISADDAQIEVINDPAQVPNCNIPEDVDLINFEDTSSEHQRETVNQLKLISVDKEKVVHTSNDTENDFIDLEEQVEVLKTPVEIPKGDSTNRDPLANNQFEVSEIPVGYKQQLTQDKENIKNDISANDAQIEVINDPAQVPNCNIPEDVDLINFGDTSSEHQRETVNQLKLIGVDKEKVVHTNNDTENNFIDLEKQVEVLKTPVEIPKGDSTNRDPLANNQFEVSEIPVGYKQQLTQDKENIKNDTLNSEQDSKDTNITDRDLDADSSFSSNASTEETTAESMAWYQMKIWEKQQDGVPEEVIDEIAYITAAIDEVKVKIEQSKSQEDRTDIYLILIKLMRDVNKIKNDTFNEEIMALQHRALRDINGCLKELQN